MDECAIIGHGVASASLDVIDQLRKDPGPGRPKTLEFQILKHADEHTVLALAAMLNGLAKFSSSVDMSHWGVVAAPRWPGRFGTATALERYRADGPRGVSPLAIPTLCLHALSGTISLAFQMRGPNFGVGGGLGCVADGLVAGLGVHLDYRLPGTWVVLVEWGVEPGQIGKQTMPEASALALALGDVNKAPAGPRLSLRATAQKTAGPAQPRLAEFSSFVLDPSPKSPWTCTLDWGMELVLTAGDSCA